MTLIRSVQVHPVHHISLTPIMTLKMDISDITQMENYNLDFDIKHYDIKIIIIHNLK